MVSEARLRHVQRYVAETPWALLPGTLEAICEVVALRATGERLPAAEVQARIGTGPAQRPTSSVGAVAVIPVYGVIMPRAGVFTDISGGTSIDQLRQDFVNQVAPEVLELGLSLPDPELQFDQVSGNWLIGPIDWDEFWRVVKGDGPCNAERLAARRKAHADGEWVREALAGYAERQPAA